MKRAGALFALCLLLSSGSFAQFELASVVGIVKDPTGLPVAQVVVEIRSVATNANDRP